MKAPSSGPALLLVNPTSGRGRGLKHWEQTAAALHAAGFTPVVRITESLQEATDRARAATAGTLVAVLGGDGFLGAAECFDTRPLYVVSGAGFVVGVEGAEYFGDLEGRDGAAEA